jgi:hypothetical protein
MEPQWQSTGVKQEIPSELDRTPPFDPRTGEHLWTMITMYRWGGPGVERPTLDMENLLSVVGPGCYYCEQPYSEYLAKRRCKGEQT